MTRLKEIFPTWKTACPTEADALKHELTPIKSELNALAFSQLQAGLAILTGVKPKVRCMRHDA